MADALLIGATVLLSGGIDSAVCLAWAIAEYGRENVRALFVEYGQRHWVERRSAGLVARALGVELDSETLGARGIGLRTALIGRGHDSRPTDAASYVVPGRNVFFLTLAAVHARQYGRDHIVLGSNADDHADFPDCRHVFMHKMADALTLALGPTIHIQTPLMYLTKAQTIERARELGCWELLGATWTCYAPRQLGRVHEVEPCGKCPACVARTNAFREMGEDDPYQDDLAELHVRGGALPASRPAGAQVQEDARPLIPSESLRRRSDEE